MNHLTRLQIIFGLIFLLFTAADNDVVDDVVDDVDIDNDIDYDVVDDDDDVDDDGVDDDGGYYYVDGGDDDVRPQQEGLCVPPLNSMPYVDPAASTCLSNQGEPVETSKHALVFLPTLPTEQECDNILSASSSGVILTGTAAMGEIGPLVGKRDVRVADDHYYFRVSLPGVAREDFTCDVTPDGKILIKGVTTTGEKTVYRNSLKFEMVTQNLCPPGPFSISFHLPGPVDSRHFTAHLGVDGVFEGIVKTKA